MSRAPIHGNPRNEYPQEAINRTLREIGLPEENAAAEELIGHVPVLGLLRNISKAGEIKEHVEDPQYLHNTAGRGLETNYQRGAPWDTFGKDADVPMMSEGGEITQNDMEALGKFDPADRMTQKDMSFVDKIDPAGPVEIPEEIREYVENAHKATRESRPDESWRITSAKKPDSIAPYKRDEEAWEDLPEKVRAEGPGSSELPHYDEGGPVQPYEVDGGASDTVKMNGQGVAPPAPVDLGDIPAAATPLPVPASPAVPRAPAPAATAPAKPQPTDQDFMDRANKMLGLGPDQQAGFMKLLGQNAQKAQLGAGLAGIGDAIAAGGTLGKVNPGALNKSEDLIQGRTKEGLEGLQTIRENQKESFGLGQTLRANEPFSPEIQKSLVTQFHIPAALAGSPRDVIYKMLDPIAQTQLKEAELQAQESYKKAAIDLQKKTLDATIANQKSERAIAKEGHQLEATKTLADQGFLKKGANLVTPSGRAATSTLENISKGQDAAGPYGEETTRNGKNYEWSPETGKYHLKR